MGPRPPRISLLAVCFLTISTFSMAQTAPVRALVTTAVDETNLITLKGNTHPLARPAFDVGAASPSMPLNRMLLVLKPSFEQEHALRTVLDNQQDKLSPLYHKWLEPDEFGAQFGLADQDLATITQWLQSHGFEINRVTHGRTMIEFSGTEGQVEGAFHTAIHKFLVNGEEHWANASDPQIPAALAPAVAGILSLHNFHKKQNILRGSGPYTTKYTPGESPATNFTTKNGTLHALSPADFTKIYNIDPVYAGFRGDGPIAIVARSNLFNGGSDVRDFWTVFNVQRGGLLNIILDGPDPGDLGGDEEAEATLDASWSGAVAPGATVDLVVSASTDSTDGVDLSELYIIDNKVASVMSESFIACDKVFQAEAAAFSRLAEQAAAEGITYMVSSGDAGAAGCADPTVVPAAPGTAVNLLGTPFNVVVGGTQFNESGNDSRYWSSANQAANLSSAISYIPENAWNESCQSCEAPNLFSSGGGASTYSKPPWQSGVSGIPNDNLRDQPDVALTAAVIHDPYILCLEGSCVLDSTGAFNVFLFGGTSVSAPAFAGIMNLVDQQNGGAQGQANYVLYSLAAAETNSFSQCNASNTVTAPAATCVFNDVTSGSNSVPGQSGFLAGPGYDLATGLGSVNVANLVNSWSSTTFRATTTTLGPDPVTGTHGLPVTLNVSVTPNSGSGTPTGDVSLVTSNQQAVGAFALNNGSISPMVVNNLPGGTYALTAQYGGDAAFKPSPPSKAVNVNITAEPSTTTVSLIGADRKQFVSGSYGSFVYVRADVAGSSGVGFPTGGVLFTDRVNGATTLTNLGTINLNAEGNTAPPNGYLDFSTGSHSIVAHYAGDPSFTASSSKAVVFSITQAATATALSPVSGVVAGNLLTLTANISSPAFAGSNVSCAPWSCESSQYPSGTVAFFAGSKQLGADAQVTANQINAEGITAVASISTTDLPLGESTITAQYSGDPNYLSSRAPDITINVDADFAIAAANASVSVSRGAHAANSLTITGQTGYNATINFSSASCSGLPALASCSFTPATVTGNGSTNITIQTTGPTSAALRAPEWTAIGLVFAGALLCGVPRRRKRFLGLSVLLLSSALGSSGCGGASSSSRGTANPGTPPGSYNITVTATTSDNVVSHAASFTLVVQ